MKKFTLTHDAKKEDLVQLVKAHKEEITRFRLMATRNTGQLIMEKTNIPVVLMQSIPMATNIATVEAVLHLLAEHPEALHGHHLIAEYLYEIAAIHN
jgi:methylglyoxal synthase